MEETMKERVGHQPRQQGGQGRQRFVQRLVVVGDEDDMWRRLGKARKYQRQCEGYRKGQERPCGIEISRHHYTSSIVGTLKRLFC